MKKEDPILKLFFEQSAKHWHFEEILKVANISRPQAAYWLKKFIKECLIRRVKPKRKMPYYIGKVESSTYKNRKRLYALKQFYETGFLNHLQSLPQAKTVIIFGSFARADWHDQSDIDLFIYGNDDELEQGKYELKLHRDIQVFTVKSKKDFKRFAPGLLKDIAEGYKVKGKLDFAEVKAHA